MIKTKQNQQLKFQSLPGVWNTTKSNHHPFVSSMVWLRKSNYPVQFRQNLAEIRRCSNGMECVQVLYGTACSWFYHDSFGPWHNWGHILCCCCSQLWPSSLSWWPWFACGFSCLAFVPFFGQFRYPLYFQTFQSVYLIFIKCWWIMLWLLWFA